MTKQSNFDSGKAIGELYLGVVSSGVDKETAIKLIAYAVNPHKGQHDNYMFKILKSIIENA